MMLFFLNFESVVLFRCRFVVLTQFHNLLIFLSFNINNYLLMN